MHALRDGGWVSPRSVGQAFGHAPPQSRLASFAPINVSAHVDGAHAAVVCPPAVVTWQIPDAHAPCATFRVTPTGPYCVGPPPGRSVQGSPSARGMRGSWP